MERIDNNTFLLKNCNNIIHHFVNEILENDKVLFSTYERKHFLENDNQNATFKLYTKDDNFQKKILDDTFSSILNKIEKIETQI
jgi:DNA-directed RNA polymerase subunit L